MPERRPMVLEPLRRTEEITPSEIRHLVEWRDTFLCMSAYCFAVACFYGPVWGGVVCLPLSLASAHLSRIVREAPRCPS